MPAQAITQACPKCQMPLVLPASYAGRKVPCSRCGNEVLVQLPTASPIPPDTAGAAPVVLPPHLANQPIIPTPTAVPVAGPRPPHLSGNKQANSQAALPFAANPADVPIRRRRKRGSWLATTILLLLGTAAFVGVVIVSVQYLPARLPQGVDSDTDGTDSELPLPDGTTIDKSQYTHAQKRSAGVSGILVRVDKAEVGKVHYRSSGEILETETGDYLMITINVKNKSRAEPVEYQSWYTFEFEDGPDGPQELQLIDDNGVELEVFPIPGADSVERHVVSSTKLETDDDAYDTLVFKLDPEYLENPVPSLYLALPGAAVAQPGYFRFHIPGSMVQRRD